MDTDTHNHVHACRCGDKRVKGRANERQSTMEAVLTTSCAEELDEEVLGTHLPAHTRSRPRTLQIGLT